MCNCYIFYFYLETKEKVEEVLQNDEEKNTSDANIDLLFSLFQNVEEQHETQKPLQRTSKSPR